MGERLETGEVSARKRGENYSSHSHNYLSFRSTAGTFVCWASGTRSVVVARQQPHVSCVVILKTTPALASPSPRLPLPPLLLGGCTPVSAGKSAPSVGCVCLLCAFVLLCLSGWIPRSSLRRAQQSSILVGAIHGLCLLCYASDDHDVLVPPEYLIYVCTAVTA